MTRPETARGSSATEALVTAIGVPFSVSFVSSRPGGEARRVVSPLASRVMPSSRHALSGDVVRSRAVTFRRRTDTRSIVIVHDEGAAAGFEGWAGASPPRRLPRMSEKSNSAGPRRTTSTVVPATASSATRTS